MKGFLIFGILVAFGMNVGLYLHRHYSPPVVVEVPTPRQIEPPPSIPTQPPPKSEIVPVFVEVPEFRQHSEQSAYGDIMRHSQEAPFGDRADRATNAHEITHGIHSYLRNLHTRESGKKVNGLYVLNGRGVIIEEPKMRKSKVIEFVPENLRSYRYGLYIRGQTAWDDTPLYILDEWVAYVNGAIVNVEDVQAGRYKGKDGSRTDGVYGCLDFSIYSLALAMAVEKYDSSYWETNQQFRSFLLWELKRANQTYVLGSKMKEFVWEDQEKLLNQLQTSPSAEPMRQFIQKYFEGVWLDTK